MSQTPASILPVLREAWDGLTIAKQWFADDSPLSRIERVDATMIGKQAQVGVWSDLNSAGYTATSSAGGTLNSPTNQVTNQALYTLTQHFFPISIEFGALNQTATTVQSLISAKNLEIQGAVASMRNQATRQLVTNGDGIVAQCATGGASATVSLVASPSGTAYGYDALVRNWLRPGAVVDIGTTADTDSLVTASPVSAIAESSTAPTITIGTSISTTAGTHFVYMPNPNSTTAANPELNGLRNMINSAGALGGLNPGTAGQEFWQSYRDTSTTILSIDLILSLQQKIQQKSGKTQTDMWTGLKQKYNFYSLLQNQVRFVAETKMGAGNVEEVQWNNTTITGWNAILDSDWYALTLSDFCRVTGNYKDPIWMSEIQGANQASIWNVGNTNFQDAIGYAFQVGLRRRNTQAAATALVA